MDLDEWDLSADDCDFLEKDAINQLKHSASSSSSICKNNGDKQVDSFSDNYKPSQKNSIKSGRESGPSEMVPKVAVKFSLHSSGSIVARFPYCQALVAVFQKIPKANWNAKERMWMFPTSSLSHAEKAVSSSITGFNIEVHNLDPLVRRAIFAATLISDLRERYSKIPSELELILLPFQRDGVSFVLQHGGRVLLADEMGLGKTLQAIAVLTCVRDSWPVLILTPSSLRLHWALMLKQWLKVSSSDILVVFSNSGGSFVGDFRIVHSSTKRSICLDATFNIVSYDMVPKLQTQLTDANFKVVIADESHFLKNGQAKRTNASVPILQNARYAILLSGTPALSRPIELFKQLEALYPDVYKNFHEYGRRFCQGGVFGLYQGASNHEELHNLMKTTIMIRRLKKDVLSQLPVKRRQQVLLNVLEKDVKNVKALFLENEELAAQIQTCTKKEEIESLKFMQKTLINKIYSISAEVKVPSVLDFLETVVEGGCKFLIFAHHQHMLNAIHDFLIKKKIGCIRIDGSTPAALRQTFVMDFQEVEGIKAAVLSIRAAGIGITLTAATMVIFAELSWTPGDLIQAEDRAHRIGQVSSVNIYYLLARGTVDDIIWDVIQSKVGLLGQMLDGEERSMEVAEPTGSQHTLDNFLKRCTKNEP